MAGVDVVHHQIVPGFTGKIHQWIAGDSDGEFFHFGLAKLASSAAHLDPKKKKTMTVPSKRSGGLRHTSQLPQSSVAVSPK